MSTTDQILNLLVAERDRLERAIQALQGTPLRGRPPGGMAAVGGGHRERTAAQRKAQSEKMKAYWAKRRKDAAKA